MVEPATDTSAPATAPWICGVRTKPRRLIVDERGDPMPPRHLGYLGWRGISGELSLVVDVLTEPSHYGPPDEYRLEPHGTLPCNWTRKNG